MDQKIVRKLTALDIAERKFTANGKLYLIEERLSEKRYIKWEMLQAQVGLNINFQHLKELLNQAWAHLNKQNFADSAVIIRDIMEGMNRNYDERIPDCIQMCALFMNTEDEDRRFISDDLIKQKAADWRAEGIDMQSFFSFAVATIPGLISNFRNITRDTSNG
jgi:hypothetical protein